MWYSKKYEFEDSNKWFCNWGVYNLQAIAIEKGLSDYEALIYVMENHLNAECFVAYFKYRCEDDEEYTFAAIPCSLPSVLSDEIRWFTNWDKGAHDIEYISVMVIGEEL